MLRRYVHRVALVVVVSAAPVHAETQFADGFEAAPTLADLFSESRWHNMQHSYATNEITVSTTRVHEGKGALRCLAQPYDGRTASKADVQREAFDFRKGDDVWFSGWYLIEAGGSAANLFLWDLEGSGAFGDSPGRRLYLGGREELVSDMKGGTSNDTFRQVRGTEVPWPRGRWVLLTVHLRLSEKSDGLMEVWQDDVLVLVGRGRTLPAATMVYHRLQVGITANGSTLAEHTVFVDDVAIGIEEPPSTSATCGNGTVESGEGCDDGNVRNGDCCSALCLLEPAGQACGDDGNVCTQDICSGTGTCVHPAGNAGAVCRPIADRCDVAETCTGTSTVCPADLTALRSTQKLRKIRLRPRERALESIRFRRRCRGAR
jgi:cysteine-rich repeat protein